MGSQICRIKKARDLSYGQGKKECLWKIAGLMEDLFLGGYRSIILGYRRLSVKSLLGIIIMLLSLEELFIIHTGLFIFTIIYINYQFFGVKINLNIIIVNINNPV